MNPKDTLDNLVKEVRSLEGVLGPYQRSRYIEKKTDILCSTAACDPQSHIRNYEVLRAYLLSLKGDSRVG